VILRQCCALHEEGFGQVGAGGMWACEQIAVCHGRRRFMVSACKGGWGWRHVMAWQHPLAHISAAALSTH
jgi:hypothetical protein